MSDKIGVLGVATTLTTGATTVYQVPSGKAAKVKIFYRGQAGSGGASTLTITVNGVVVMEKGATTASHYIFSSINALMDTGSAAPTGVDGDTTAAPAPPEYYLSENDTIAYTIGGEAFQAMSFQVVGTEVDV